MLNGTEKETSRKKECVEVQDKGDKVFKTNNKSSQDLGNKHMMLRKAGLDNQH